MYKGPKPDNNQDDEYVPCEPVDPDVPEVEVDFISDEE